MALAKKEQAEAEEAERRAEAEAEDVVVAELRLEEAEQELEDAHRAQIEAGDAGAMEASFQFFDADGCRPAALLAPRPVLVQLARPARTSLCLCGAHPSGISHGEWQ